MRRHTNGAVTWLTFDLLEECPRLVHRVFLRHGGISQGEFRSLNFGRFQGDKEIHVVENRKRALEALTLTAWCSLRQQHGKRVVKALPNLDELGDALSTDLPDLGLIILHADCQAAIFYDPIRHALSNVHCGWRGNVQNIYKETIDAMQALYGSKPADLLVGISPSLGPQASEFVNFATELPTNFYPFQIKPTYFDLWSISRWQLMECGLLPHHIEIAEICTYDNSTDFFSYRRIKASGRHATIAALKK
jgi:YfiH family protein